MLNEKAVLLLERVIKNEYTNVNLDSKYFDENEFYYEFKCDEKVSENDFNNLEEKINMIKNISKENIFIDTKKLTIKNTHGDFNILQFIYKNNHINSVIDFVSACRMPIVWELIRSYSYIDKNVKNGIFNLDTFTDYIKEFNKYVKLNDYDLKYMSYIYLIQLLSSTYGYKEYINNNENIELLEFAYFRTNICKYLFNNAENISNRLLKSLKICVNLMVSR